jgi:8-oxo-dGTP pyrophosphatase MutT (NUDIX family)
MKARTTGLKRRVLWQGAYIRAVVLTYPDRLGRARQWEAVERVNCSGIVVIVPVTPQEDVLLIRQFRPALNRTVIEFPAGLGEPGETLAEVARRELVEETGYDSADLCLLTEGPLSSRLSSEILTVFLARNVEPASPEMLARHTPEETEEIQLITMPLGDVHERLAAAGRRHKDLVDMKVFGLAELAKRMLERCGASPAEKRHNARGKEK